MSNAGYEKSDINLNKVILTAVLSIIAVTIIVIFVVDHFTAIQEEVTYNQVDVPVPQALIDLRAREDEALNYYHLLDAKKGIYSIPISRAMELTAQEAGR